MDEPRSEHFLRSAVTYLHHEVKKGTGYADALFTASVVYELDEETIEAAYLTTYSKGNK